MNGKRNDKTHKVFILLGSNIDPIKNIIAATKLINEQLQISKLSQLYQSPAVGVSEPQPNYLNSVVMIIWSKPIKELRDILRSIEQNLGRKRYVEKFAARTIDLDILLFGDKIVNTEDIQIPDPNIIKHSFILFPLFDVAPNFVHPVERKSISQIFQELRSDISIDVVTLPDYEVILDKIKSV